MNRKVLIEGYQPEPSKGSWTKRDERTGAFRQVSPSGLSKGPTASEPLPKTNSSVSIPKK